MAATQVGIIYSSSQKVIRQIIHTRWLGYDKNRNPIPDPNADDSSLDAHKNAMLPGESWATIPISDYDTITSHSGLHTYLGLTGTPGVSDRCIVHGNGLVKAVVLGDPQIDTHPLGALVADTTGKAVVGLSVVNGIAQIPAPPVQLTLQQFLATQAVRDVSAT